MVKSVKKKKMKKLITHMILALFLFGGGISLMAQEETTEKPVDKPVRPPFQSGYLIDAQTTFLPTEGTLELVIHHRFGPTSNGTSDLWGVYAPSNIRLGFNYSVKDWLQLGIGTTKFKKFQDVTYKALLLEQTRSGRVPVSIAFYGNIAVDARDEAIFGSEYEFQHRLSYFNQIIISRKVNDKISVQVAPSYSHFNMVEEGRQHRYVGLSLSGRARISPQTSIVFNYDTPIEIDGLLVKGKAGLDGTFENELPKANIAVGIEVATSTHAFHIFLASSQGIIPQENFVFNQNDFFDGGMVLGFNITRLWNW